MKDCTNNGCQCTPNQSINCTVNNCAHHCQDSNYCGLTSIRVGTHETNPTEIKCTDCPELRAEVSGTGGARAHPSQSIRLYVHLSAFRG